MKRSVFLLFFCIVVVSTAPANPEPTKDDQSTQDEYLFRLGFRGQEGDDISVFSDESTAPIIDEEGLTTEDSIGEFTTTKEMPSTLKPIKKSSKICFNIETCD